MNPEFLPEFALLLAGVFLGAVAVRLLVARRWRRAMGLGAISVTLILVGLVAGKYGTHWKYSERWRLRPSMRPAPLVPVASPERVKPDSEGARYVSLLLGDVLLQVGASDRYVLSADNEPFLILDSLGSELLVSCRVAGSHYPARIRTPRLAVDIVQNAVVYSGTATKTMRPDAHTIVVQEGDKEILRIRYAEPKMIEVAGQFYLSDGAGPSVISLSKGIKWRGTGIPKGTIDLRPQGQGRINFDHSGMIQVLRERMKR